LQELSGSKLQADSNAIPLVLHEVHTLILEDVLLFIAPLWIYWLQILFFESPDCGIQMHWSSSDTFIK